MMARLVVILLVVSLPLCSCGYVPESESNECQTTLLLQQQTEETQRKQIKALTQEVSENESCLLTLENEHERIAEELRAFETSWAQNVIPVRAYVKIDFGPSSAVCTGESITWTLVLSETHGVGVTFTEMVDWYRTMEGPFGTGYSTRSYHDGTTDPGLLPVRVEAGGRVDLDLGGKECFSEKRQYYYVLFGVDDNGDEVVTADALVVDLWEPSE